MVINAAAHTGVFEQIGAIDHAEGNSSARPIEPGRIKGVAMGRSLVYVMNKHKRPLDLPAARYPTAEIAIATCGVNRARRTKLLASMKGLDGPFAGGY